MATEMDDDLERLVFGLIPRLTEIARRHLTARLRSKLDAEDLVQSMVASWFKDRARSQASETRDEKELLGLLIFRLKQKLADRLRYYNAEKRSVGREVSLGSLQTGVRNEGPWEPVARDERDRPDIEDEINRLLNDLPEEHRLIVILRDIEGWSETQIGEEMRLSRFAVRRRYDQAITRMKTRFGGREPN